MLGGMSLGETEKSRSDYISQIVKKARDSVNALDVIVWAVNPRENTLQSLADYLASFADEFLSASGIACRLNLPVSFPAVTLDGRTRHDLFLATKEALHNAVRHAGATEVELSLALGAGTTLHHSEGQRQRVCTGHQRLRSWAGQYAGTTRQTRRSMPN